MFFVFTPSSTTSPDTSRPKISLASFGGGYPPSLCKRSGLLTPAAFTLIKTSFYFGFGTGLDPIYNTTGPP